MKKYLVIFQIDLAKSFNLICFVNQVKLKYDLFLYAFLAPFMERSIGTPPT